jgi:arachidonate 15-lipoxygenase
MHSTASLVTDTAFVASFSRTGSVATGRKQSSFVPAAISSLKPAVVGVAAKTAKHARVDTSMILGLKSFVLQDVVDIPQKDTANAAQRAKDVKLGRENYKWTRKGCGNASLIDGLPKEENPRFGWIEEVAKIAVRVATNSAANGVNDAGEGLDKIQDNILMKMGEFVANVFAKISTGKFDTEAARAAINAFTGILQGNAQGQGCTFEEYEEQFVTIKPDTVASLEQFLRDDIFGWYRVAGPNPMRLTKLRGKATDMFPLLTNALFQGIPGFQGDTLEKAAAENRLFFVDYKELKDVPVGHLPDGSPKKGYYVYSPRALFAVPTNLDDRTTVLPIAIQCGQGSSFPMFTPNATHTDPITWLAAKLTVQVSDALLHESMYHLGRTHLLLEVFICASHRTFPEAHPIFRLLKNHFYGTAFINFAAVNTLINPGGIIDQITAPEILTTCQLSAQSVNDPSFSFNEWMPDKEMASRGILDAGKLKYPYRDDAMKLWKVVNEWVRGYVSAYYTSDDDVVKDTELANWCREVTSADLGNLHGFGETPDGLIKTVDYLVRAVSMIIFTASVQHAAVNFPQSTLMQYTPAMPLCGYAPAPTTAKPFSSMNDWVAKMIPDLKKAQVQLSTAEIIGVLRYSVLGEYGKNLNFAPDQVDVALAEFQKKLGQIGSDIMQRNAKERQAGLPVYDHLVPKNIPQSINV